MQPNINVYGVESDRQQQYFSQASDINSPPVNRCASFNDNNYSQLYFGLQNERVQTDQPIDISICYAALGVESDSSHCHSIVVENNNLALKTVDRDITNYFFWERTGTSYINVTNGAIAFDSTYSWHGNIGDGNMNAQISPICNINVKNQVLCIRVRALNADKTTAIDVTLDSYLTQYEQYPNVFMVYAKSFNGWKIPRGTNMMHSSDSGNVEFGMGLLEPYCNYNGDENIYCFAVEQHLNTSVYTPTQNMFVLSGSMQYNDTCRVAHDNIPVLKAHDPENWVVEFANSNYVRVYKEITSSNIQEFFEECLKQCACFGLYFTPVESVAVSGTLTDDNMYIGIIDNGIGHGRYLKGNNTVSAPQNNYNSMSDIDYDPYNPHNYDNTNYINDTQFYYQIPAKGAIKYYTLTESNVDALLTKLYSATVDDVQQGENIESHNLRAFLTKNSIDCITSLTKFPCEVLHGILPESIKLGTYDSGILAYPLLFVTDRFSFSFNLSKNNGLYPVYGDFRDNEPLTKAELTIPFCGTVQIPTTYLYQYDDLTIDLIVDYITGACTAVIMCNGIAIDSVSGSCGIQLPVTGIQANNIDSAINSLALQDNKRMNSVGLALLGGAFALGAAIFTGGATAIAAAAIGATTGIAGTAINAAEQGKQIDYELSHMDLPIKTVGGASAQISQSMDMRCKLRITRPVMSDDYNAEIYAKNIGFACLINGDVKDFTGLTIGDICTDGISATTDEKNMIQTLFKTGVYL